MEYNVIDIIEPNLTEENLKDIINKKLYNILLFMEIRPINEG